MGAKSLHFPAVILLAFICFCASPARAIILFGADNSANTSDPGGGLPWDAVGKLTNSTATTVAPSAIYLGNGYMLTANHVDMTGLTSVTFDGTSTLLIDTSYTPKQVAAGVDLKIFKLTTNPSVTAVHLLSLPVEQVANAYMVGWGVGRDPAESVGDTSVLWGNNATATKRWAINVPKVATTIGGYDAIKTFLGSPTGTPSGVGADEGALTINDSGSALFQKLGDTWYLIGVATTVETAGTSNFGNDTSTLPHGDYNGFVRISSYAEDIDKIIAVPEPAALPLAALAALAGWAMRPLSRRTRR